MLQRVPLVIFTHVKENFAFILGWILIWFSDIPEWIVKFSIGILYGVAIVIGKEVGNYLVGVYKVVIREDGCLSCAIRKIIKKK